jgi:hypothetical protein
MDKLDTQWTESNLTLEHMFCTIPITYSSGETIPL